MSSPRTLRVKQWLESQNGQNQNKHLKMDQSLINLCENINVEEKFKLNTEKGCLLPKKLYDVVTKQSKPVRKGIFTNRSISLFIIFNQLFIFFLLYVFGVPDFINSNINKENRMVLAEPRINLELKSLHQDIMMISRKIDMLRADNYVQKKNKLAIDSEIKDLDTRILNALDLYDADKIGLKDYALEKFGATITSTPDTISWSCGKVITLFGLPIAQKSNANKILQTDTTPGECYAFHGSIGRIRIKLSQKIKITAVTLEHAHFSLVDDISSAPKDFIVYGLDDENSEIQDTIGKFTYNIRSKCLQIFEVEDPEDKFYEHVELFIKSNHGHKEFTCIYRFRVHGNTAN